MTQQNLYTKLKHAKSEEDVKDIYIKTLGLKSYNKGVFNVDISTDEIWFEAKITGKHSAYDMFTQLLHYVQIGLDKGEVVPPFLAVIDTEKAALMKTSDILPFLAKKTVKWGKSASQYTKATLDEVSANIGAHFVQFHLESHEEEFINTVKEAIKSGEIIGRQITPDNLKQVFDKWVSMIGREIIGASEKDYSLFFFADIMHEDECAVYDNLPATLGYKNKHPIFCLDKKVHELATQNGYKQFWKIYIRPPKSEYRDYLLERRDSLIPLNERSFKGAFYTPLNVVDKAYDKLAEILGQNWQQEYLIWDMCCGVGNLEIKHSNPRNLFMSTLDRADIDIMQANNTCAAAQRFQYDYLNDDISDNGKIDYGLTNKIPLELRQAISENKKILVLINPPYAEATSSDNINSGGTALASKTGVAKTKFATTAMAQWGKASNELFTQFVARIAQEMPTATLAMFSTLKYVNSQTMDIFRSTWNATYLGGFVVHSKVFDGLRGNFPIGFLVWSTNQNARKKLPIIQITAEVFDKNVQAIGEKVFYNLPNKQLLTNWIERPKTTEKEVIPLKNAITPATATKDLRGIKWSDNAIAFLWCNSNDVQQAARTALFSSGFNGGHGIFINDENLWQAAVIFSVRQLVSHTWLNHNDQFLQPIVPLSDEFKNDCLIWMLFHGKNLTASADNLEWNGKTWSIVNHFIPFTEMEVNARGRFESDFMVQYLKDKTVSKEAENVLNSGRELWKSYFAQTDEYRVREELKLNRPDVGWYQIRNALKKRNENNDVPSVDFSVFESAYKILTEKLQPQVFELGFLRT
jgi:hypothetical protein